MGSQRTGHDLATDQRGTLMYVFFPDYLLNLYKNLRNLVHLGFTDMGTETGEVR